MTATLGADELRARYLLRVRGLAYTPGAPVPDKSAPITPTGVYPAGTPLPPRAPEPGEMPPWRVPPPPVDTPPPPPAPVPAPPAPEPPPAVPIEITHIHKIVMEPAQAPTPTWWDRAKAALRGIGRPWQFGAALAAAVIPVPPGHYSLATTWWWCVDQTRDQHGMAAGYALALGAVLAAAALLHRRPGLIRLTLLAVAAIGALGAVHLFDPITALTGVHR